MRYLMFLLLFSSFSSFSSFGQLNSNLAKAERFLLSQNSDSASYYINVSTITDSEYFATLKKAIEGNELSYEEHEILFSKLNTKQDLNHLNIYDFFKEKVKTPEITDGFNYNYIKTCWTQITRLLNEGLIDESNIEQENLAAYINKFNEDLIEVQKSKSLIKTHDIIITLIEKDMEKGDSLSESIINEGKRLKDTNLIIIGMYYKSEFLISKRKLDEYIEISEKAIELEANHEKKSEYYEANLMHLIDALIYKGGEEERVFNLLEVLFQNPNSKIASYAYYAKFLRYTNPDSKYVKQIFEKFKVDNIKSFVRKIKDQSKPVLNDNDYFFILWESSNALENFDEKDTALKLMRQCISITKKIYAKDLSESLASYKTRTIRAEKEKEIQQQKEKTQLYIILAILSLALMLISIVAYIMKRKRSFLLEKQNAEIEKQRELLEKSDQEKGYFLKEIHHRVKNNFQIISSLLEIQLKQNESEQNRQLVNESRSRVKSMALIHQRLYQNDDLYINLKDYLEELVNEIQNTFSTSHKLEVNMQVDPDYSLDIDTAIPIGLIVNELITNTFKYGLNENENTLEISLSGKNEENKVLSITDNGPGLPAEIEIAKSETMGLRLVRRLAKQLHGKAEYSYNNGAQFLISFKETYLRTLVD